MHQRKMRRKEQREFLESRRDDLLEIFREQEVGDLLGKRGVWEIEEEGWKFYRIGERGLLVLIENRLLPVLHRTFNPNIGISLPSLVIDKGAIPHVSNGADVMRPGVVLVTGSFKKGSLVTVKDQTYHRVLAVAEALDDSQRVEGAERGRIAKNLHYVGDKIWKVAASVAGSVG